VLDLLLPGLHGDEFLKHLRTSSGSQIPVIVVSVKDLGPDERAELEDLHVVGVLRKGPGVARNAAELVNRALRELGGLAA
jgi:CheY-like chemotaxis protein